MSLALVVLVGYLGQWCRGQIILLALLWQMKEGPKGGMCLPWAGVWMF